MSNKLYELRSRIREFEKYIKNTPIEDEKDLEALNSIEQYHKQKNLSEDDKKIYANELYNHWMRIVDRRISRQKCDNSQVLENENEKELRNIFNNLQEKYKC